MRTLTSLEHEALAAACKGGCSYLLYSTVLYCTEYIPVITGDKRKITKYYTVNWGGAV